MGKPTLKRITITSEVALRNWLRTNVHVEGELMLVTHSDARSPKHVSTAQVQSALNDFNWKTGRRYTLNTHLLGHVAHKQSSA